MAHLNQTWLDNPIESVYTYVNINIIYIIHIYIYVYIWEVNPAMSSKGVSFAQHPRS